ncbi:hypothetical protein VM98_34675 [Streptomyces rubellomurinus subsp. indigoferus]|nr:hypothetical protein VM98_34675 [Streptomyces rubellomurinus subsp. indigoferus]
MVREFGLSPELGPVGYSSGSPQNLGEGLEDLLRRPYSDQPQHTVDEGVAWLPRRADRRAVELLRAHRPHLAELAALLVARAPVDGPVVLEILRHPAADPAAPRPGS